MLLWGALMLVKPVGPYRDAEVEVRSVAAATDLVPCIARVLGKAGTIAVLPVQGGSAIDLQDKPTLLGMRGTPRFSIQVTDAGEQRVIHATYRHPFTRKAAEQLVGDAGKHCFPDEWRMHQEDRE